MKRMFVLAFTILLSPYLYGQECDPDSAFINSDAIISPTPFLNDTVGEGLPPACLNTEYSITVFIRPPSQTVFNGFPVTVTSFRVDTVVNLPIGINYSCDNEDCLFLADSIGCIYLSGTPGTENKIDSNYVLTIQGEGIIGGIPLSITNESFTEGEYAIRVLEEGNEQCDMTLSSKDHRGLDLTMRIFPNPANDVIGVRQISGLNYDFERHLRIVDIAGKSLYTSAIPAGSLLDESVLIAHLKAGIYFVGIESEYGRQWSKFVKR